MALEILYQDQDLVAIMKPARMHVHQPEEACHRVSPEQTVLWVLRRQIEKYLYPIHRLDAGTEGVLLMGLSSQAARKYQQLFQGGQVKKTYHALCRGWVDDSGKIEIPLERDSNQSLVDAQTSFTCLNKVEHPFQIGKRYNQSRYSYVEIQPHTGRWHQIRRHFARTSHPIVGDREHGDSHHNKYFRVNLGLGGLWLRAESLEFEGMKLNALPTERWSKMQELLLPQTGPDNC